MSPRHVVRAALFDILAIVIFVAIGRRSHDEPGNVVVDAGVVAAPFLIGLAVAWLVVRAWRQPLGFRTGVAIWPITIVVGMVLRRFVFDRGTAASFIVVATIATGVLLVGWRAVEAILRSRYAPPTPPSNTGSRNEQDMTKRASQPDDAVVSALARVDLFSDLTTTDLQQIAAMCRPEEFQSGDEIVAQGDTSGRFYLVLQGTADIIVNGAKVGDVGPGGSFGEIAVIDRGPRSASVQATSAVQACSVASITLRPLLREHPDMSYRLLVGLCQLLRRTQDTLVT